MEQFTKPLDLAFVIKEEKVDEFLKHQPNKEKKKEILEKAERISKQITYKE